MIHYGYTQNLPCFSPLAFEGLFLKKETYVYFSTHHLKHER